MLRRRTPREERPFSFLSREQEDELNAAMRSIEEKLERELAQKGGKPRAAAEATFQDPRLAYRWYERCFDDAFTRDQHQLMATEAFYLNTVTGQPQLSTFRGRDTFDVNRQVSPAEVDSCFERLWTSARENRGKPIPQKEELKRPPTRTLAQLAPLPPRLAALSAPRKLPPWVPPAEMTFAPRLVSSAKLRRRAVASPSKTRALPPVAAPAKSKPRRPTVAEDGDDEESDDGDDDDDNDEEEEEEGSGSKSNGEEEEEGGEGDG